MIFSRGDLLLLLLLRKAQQKLCSRFKNTGLKRQ